MDEALYCQGPYLARRLYRLSTIIDKAGFHEAASFVAIAALTVCEPATDGERPNSCSCSAIRRRPWKYAADPDAPWPT